MHHQNRKLNFVDFEKLRRAVLNNDRVYVFESYGEFRVYHENYHELLDGPVDKQTILYAMESMSRILK